MSERDPAGTVHTTRDGHVLVMEIDREEKRNAFTPEMLAALARAYDELERDPELRCGVVCAKGAHFTAGLDMIAMAPTFAEGADPIPAGSVNPWATTGRHKTKPVVLAVQGKCLTLGIELALASDTTIAAEDVSFAQIEVQRGIFPFGGATTRFVRTAGWGNAMRFMLTGDPFSAATAFRIGVVQEVVPLEELRARALAVARSIAAQAPLAVRATLQNAALGLVAWPQAAHDELLPTLLDLAKSEDAAEGIQSFAGRCLSRPLAVPRAATRLS